MDHEWMPDVLNIELKNVPDDVIHSLRGMGHTFGESAWPWRQGDAHSIFVDPKTGLYYGAADGRSEGAAIGY
jgi:gamma-glutamyltranspeptidase/glutathione hydrolase